jgi:hypothetical protein
VVYRHGEVVRERRRHGLPVPLADKVLPFRPVASAGLIPEPPAEEKIREGGAAQRVVGVRMVDAWRRFAEAEQRQTSPRALQALETAYLQEAQSYAATCDRS